MDNGKVTEHFQVFKYATPTQWSEQQENRGKQSLQMGRAGGLNFAAQVVKRGGETNLHSHTELDSAWFVLKGRAKFYGIGDVVVGDLSTGEGIMIPGGVPYWFESASEEVLEILHITSHDKSKKAERVNFEPKLANQMSSGRTATEEEMVQGRSI